MLNTINEDLQQLFRILQNSTVPDASGSGEYPNILRVLNKIKVPNKIAVDIGAGDGSHMSCTLGLAKQGWHLVGFEAEPILFAGLAFLYRHTNNVQLHRDFITPQNVLDCFRAFEIPKNFGFLNVDIDSYDIWVLDQLLTGGYRPAIISIEINSAIPSGVFFSVTDQNYRHEDGEHYLLLGSSLTAVESIVKKHGYILESLQYMNAFFVDKTVEGANELVDLTAYQAYHDGYLSKSDRYHGYKMHLEIVQKLELMDKKSAVQFLKQYFSGTKYSYMLYSLNE
jgi:hypothetical protein